MQSRQQLLHPVLSRFQDPHSRHQIPPEASAEARLADLAGAVQNPYEDLLRKVLRFGMAAYSAHKESDKSRPPLPAEVIRIYAGDVLHALPCADDGPLKVRRPWNAKGQLETPENSDISWVKTPGEGRKTRANADVA
jgi:hypothetical protein